MKIPVVLDFDKTFTSDSQIVYHVRDYKLALFKMIIIIVYQMYSKY